MNACATWPEWVQTWVAEDLACGNVLGQIRTSRGLQPVGVARASGAAAINNQAVAVVVNSRSASQPRSALARERVRKSASVDVGRRVQIQMVTNLHERDRSLPLLLRRARGVYPHRRRARQPPLATPAHLPMPTPSRRASMCRSTDHGVDAS